MAKAKVVKPNFKGGSKKKATAAAAKPAKKKAAGGKFTGKTTGLGVSAYQNKSILSNKKNKKSDKALAAEWRKEFPDAKDYTADDIASVRRAFNRGKHGNEAPARPIPEYDRNGNVVEEKKAAPAKKKTAKKKASKKKQAPPDDEDDEDEDEDEDLDDEDEDDEDDDE